MASLLKRTALLSLSRFTNQAILLLSPLALVRILPVAEYGRYQEFVVYAALVVSVVTFGVYRSLLYLVPKHPEQERVWITQSATFALLFSAVALVVIQIIGDFIRRNTSFDFVTELQLYTFFFVNFDFVELYWVGKKRADYVMYYTAARLLARTSIVVLVAAITDDARSIIAGLVALEIVRCVLVFVLAALGRWFTLDISHATLRLQMSYFLPLGTGAAIETLNANVGRLFVASVAGPEALAVYVIGGFATRIVDILRGAIADAIFPSMVEVKSKVVADSLPLWRRATVLYCVLLFPLSLLLIYYADAVVVVLFTESYREAVPVFAAFAVLLLIFCFDFHLPLRAQNENRFFMLGSTIALGINVALAYPMYRLFDVVGPAVALIASRVGMSLYLANRTLRVYGIGKEHLVLWRDILRVMGACIVASPILVVGKLVVDDLILRGVVFGTIYIAAYLFVVRRLGIWDSWSTFRALCASFGWRKVDV